MKVTLISTSDRSGGAAIACMRLADALAGHGHDVRVLVMEKKGQDPLALPAAPAPPDPVDRMGSGVARMAGWLSF